MMMVASITRDQANVPTFRNFLSLIIMKVTKTYGCTTASFCIDDVPYTKLTSKERLRVSQKILQKIASSIEDGSIQIEDIIDAIQYDSYKSSEEPCEQCGDHISTTTWII
jgi:hypothetical protein